MAKAVLAKSIYYKFCLNNLKKRFKKPFIHELLNELVKLQKEVIAPELKYWL